MIGFKDEYVPKWVYFAIYWVGLSLRKLRPDFASNNTLHCLEYRPAYYNFAKKVIWQIIKKNFHWCNQIDHQEGVRYAIEILFMLPRIVSKFPGIGFSMVYKAIHHGFVDPEVRGFSYELLHDVVPTNVFMLKYNAQRFSHCTFCGHKYEETIPHLFIKCPIVHSVWTFVQHIFWKMWNHWLKITEHMIRFV